MAKTIVLGIFPATVPTWAIFADDTDGHEGEIRIEPIHFWAQVDESPPMDFAMEGMVLDLEYGLLMVNDGACSGIFCAYSRTAYLSNDDMAYWQNAGKSIVENEKRARGLRKV